MENLYVKIFGGEKSKELFNILDKETEWKEIHNKGGLVPRLMYIQGEVNNNLVPVYRHPLDDEPKLKNFTPTVLEIKRKVEKALNIPDEQKFNHVLIQKYRSGQDFIGEHSDKTLDIAPNSYIVNYSLGSTRVMTLRSKAKISNDTYEIKNIPLHDDTCFMLDLDTNRKFKHSIHRKAQEKGERISLTFRKIATFWDRKNKKLVGQGCRSDATFVDNEKEKQDLLNAFSRENSDPNFDWQDNYGSGFNVSFISYVDDEPITSEETAIKPTVNEKIIRYRRKSEKEMDEYNYKKRNKTI